MAARPARYPLAALIAADLLVLTDTTHDPRFEAVSGALGGLWVGFCAASKLTHPDGQNLGYLYLLRREPRTFASMTRRSWMLFASPPPICTETGLGVRRPRPGRTAPIPGEAQELEGRVVAMGDGQVLFIVWHVTHERQLDRPARQHLTVMEASQDGVALLDHRRHPWYVNLALARQLGHTDPGELVGHHWGRLFPEKTCEEVLSCLEEMLSARHHWAGQLDLVRRDGGSGRQEVVLTAFEDGNTLLVAHNLSRVLSQDREPADSGRLEDTQSTRAASQGNG